MEVIEKFPNVARQLLNNMIVIEAKYSHDIHSIDYLAISDLFDEVELHCRAPWYHLIWSVNKGVQAIAEMEKA